MTLVDFTEDTFERTEVWPTEGLIGCRYCLLGAKSEFFRSGNTPTIGLGGDGRSSSPTIRGGRTTGHHRGSMGNADTRLTAPEPSPPAEVRVRAGVSDDPTSVSTRF